MHNPGASVLLYSDAGRAVFSQVFGAKARAGLPAADDGSAVQASRSFSKAGFTGYLTGPITALGGRTAVASQTGTGTKFVMDASPTITTPTISGSAIFSTAATGPNFTANTPAAGMTSQLLNWYEEGTWTPAVTAGSGTITTVGTVTGRYTRKGREVTVIFSVAITTNGTGAGYIAITGVPFAPNGTPGGFSGAGFQNSTGKALAVATAGSTIYVRLYDATYPASSGEILFGSIVYNV